MPAILETEQTRTSTPIPQTRDLLTVDELIAVTGWGRTFTYQGAKTDSLPIPTLRSGRKYYFSRAAYERWLRGDQRDAAS